MNRLWTLITIGVLLAVAQPDLPNQFKAQVSVEVPFIGKVPGTLYFDYNKLSYRLDTTAFGFTAVDIYRYGIQIPAHYQIQAGACKTEKITDQLYPMSIPPIAIYKGTSQINGKTAELWEVNWFGFADLKWYVVNSTSADQKTTWSLLQFVFSTSGIDVEYDFDKVEAGPQSADLFDVTKYGCPSPVPPKTYKVQGYAKSAVDNKVIPGATVTLGSSKSTTNSQGMFEFTQVVEGNATIVFEATGFFSLTKTLIIAGDYMPGSGADGNLSPRLPAGQYRAVLTWGSTPPDLDTHVLTPTGCEVSYSKKSCVSGNSVVTLDVDATRGYGPETATFQNLSAGSYNYTVWIYTTGGSYIGSNAMVHLYNENGLVAQVNVPTTGFDPKLRRWNVFSVLNAATGNIKIINEVTV